MTVFLHKLELSRCTSGRIISSGLRVEACSYPVFDLLCGCRIDAEASRLKKKLDELITAKKVSEEAPDRALEGATLPTIQVS